MLGGLGNDIYFVDDPFDEVRVSPGQGFDYLYTSTDYALRPGVEIEAFGTANYLTTGALALIGNELNNAITGNNGGKALSREAGDDSLYGLDGDDLMNGGLGVDRMDGGAGSDIYYDENGADWILEGRAGAMTPLMPAPATGWARTWRCSAPATTS